MNTPDSYSYSAATCQCCEQRPDMVRTHNCDRRLGYEPGERLLASSGADAAIQRGGND